MKRTDDFYFELNASIRKRRTLTTAIPSLCFALSLYIFLLFFVMLTYYLLVRKYGELILCILVCGVGFLFATALRKLIAKERPYTVQHYDPIIKKERGCFSMPSRHAFSVFIIAFASLRINPWLFVVNMICGLCLCALRVLGGVHYISDVLASFVIALAFGLFFVFL